MSNAISGLIDGTKTAQEAFGQMFKNIGKAFIDMATQMIAKAMVLKVLGIFGGGAAGAGGGFPGGGGFGQSAPQLFTGGGIFNTGFSTFAGGGYTGDAPRSGGLDGQGGYTAMIHPDETIIDHRSPMSRYSNSNSLSDSGDARTSMSRYSGGNNQITGGGTSTIKFESRIINNVEYVTADQAMAMSRRAADDGAKRGMEGGYTRSMQTLRNSRSQRAKIGMS